MKKIKESGSLPGFIAIKNPTTEEERKEICHDFYVRRTELYKKLCSVHITVSNVSAAENCATIVKALGF